MLQFLAVGVALVISSLAKVYGEALLAALLDSLTRYLQRRLHRLHWLLGRSETPLSARELREARLLKLQKESPALYEVVDLLRDDIRTPSILATTLSVITGVVTNAVVFLLSYFAVKGHWLGL